MKWDWEISIEDVDGKEIFVSLCELESSLLENVPRDVLEGFIRDIRKVLSRY